MNYGESVGTGGPSSDGERGERWRDAYRVLSERLSDRRLTSLPDRGTMPIEESEERIGEAAAERVVRLALEADARGQTAKRALERLLDDRGRGYVRDILDEVRKATDAQQWMWRYVRNPDLLSGGPKAASSDRDVSEGREGPGRGDGGDGETEPDPGPSREGASRIAGETEDDAGTRRLTAPDIEVRRQAIRELRGRRSPSVVEGLSWTARDELMPPSVRAEAAEALGSIRMKDALAALLDLAVYQEDEFRDWRLREKTPVMVAAVEALAGGVWNDHPAAIQAARLAREADDPVIRAAAGGQV